MVDPLIQSDSLDESQQVFSGQAEYKITIFNYKNEPFEVNQSAFTNFNIYESLFDENVMHGDITMFDSAGFEERIPFVGEETITIEFFNARMPKTKFKGSFCIYKMSEKIVREKTQIYTLFFISEEFIVNLKQKVSKSYKGKTSQEIVQDIYDNYILTGKKKTETKPLFYDEVGNPDGAFLLNHFIFPYIRPFQALNIVAKRSLASTVTLSSTQNTIANYGSFLFFENQMGFWFKSIGDLINPQFTQQGAEFEESKQEVKDDQGQDANFLNSAARQNKNKVRIEAAPVSASVRVPMASYMLTPSDNIGHSPDSADRIISSFKFLSAFDVLSNIIGGMYGSRLLTYDPITQMLGEDNLNFSTNVSVSKREPKLLIGGQKVFFNEYGYLEEFENFRHIRERESEDTSVGGHPLNSNRHVGLGGPMASFKYKATNFRHEFKQQISLLEKELVSEDKNFQRFDNQVERTILTRNAQNRMMKNIVVEMRVQGDHNRMIGEIIELKIPSFVYPDEPGHTYYRGNYLLTKVRHVMNSNGAYHTEMQLIKDSLFNPLENDPELDSSGNKFGEEQAEILAQQEADKITEIGPELNIGKSGSRIATTKGGKQRVIGGM